MIDKLSRFQELKYAFSKMNLKEDDYYGIAQIIDEAIERECLDSGGLKSCPFCGGEAEHYHEGEWGIMYWIACKECGASSDSHAYEQESIDAWNRRT